MNIKTLGPVAHVEPWVELVERCLVVYAGAEVLTFRGWIDDWAQVQAEY